MMRSLFAGVTGLRTHQTRMDVIGNNIANVNTIGFKKSAVTFKDLYSETISAAAAPSGDGSTGGINPKQIGLGVTLNSITTVHTPGAAQYTGNTMDVAISGDGFFTVLTPTGYKYTRAGSFSLDRAGNLVSPSGHYIQVVDPVQSSDVMFVLNSVKTEGLLVANGAFSLPASNIHSGNISVDLGEAQNREYGFKYVPDGTGYKASIPRNYQPGISAATRDLMNNPDMLIGVGADGKSKVTLDMQKIADAYLATLTAGETSPGAKEVTFQETDPPSGVIELVVGGKVIATSAPVVSGTLDSTDPANEFYTAEIDFGALGKVTFYSPVNDANGDPLVYPNIDDADQITAIIGLKDTIPTIPLEEGGGWWLTDLTTGEQLEPVVLDYQAGINGGIRSGDIMFTTTGYGNFRLHLDAPLDSMDALSNELSSAKFTLDVTEEPYVIYESPSGEISQTMMKSLQVDFARYSNLTIDSKGAVIAQLKYDEILVVDGREVHMKVGDKVVLGYIALANFNNATGLEKVGDNLYEISADSGTASYMMPGSGTVGELAPSSIEMSNVDLSEEMVNMIITQRGFQANSRIITVSDTMLEELINLKR